MIHSGDKVIVCVSGGPDSLALLYALFNLQHELDCVLHVAHLDHKLRGSESAEDARFVQAHAHKLGLENTIEAINVLDAIQQDKLSLEAGARKIRYDFYERTAVAVGAHKIALGHNADDQAETVVMRLLRGSGAHGLSGIPKIRSGRYIRPLLSCSRAEIEEFLSDLQLSPRHDASNKQPIYLRNKIRLELIPLLAAEYNPTIKDVLCRTAEILHAESEFLDQIAKENLSSCLIHCQPGYIKIGLENILKQHIALQRRILRLCIAHVVGNLFNYSFEHIESIINLIVNSKPNISLSLPSNLNITKTYNTLTIHVAKLDDSISVFEYTLKIPGIIGLPLLKAAIATKLKDDSLIAPHDPFQEIFDFANITQPLKLRNRRCGDRFQPLGMQGTKKLKDFFIDMKIPLKQRDSIPLLVSSEEILWVVGYRMSEKCKITDATTHKLVVTFIPN